MNQPKDGFIEKVKAKSFLPEREFNLALKQTGRDPYKLLELLLESQIVERSELVKLYADSINFAWLEMDKVLFHPDTVAKLPKEFSLKNNIIAMFQFGDVISAAMSDPNNKKVLAEAEKLAGKPLSPSFALADDIKDAIEVQFKSVHEVEEQIKKISISALIKPNAEISAEELKQIAGEQSIIELVRSLMLLAIKEGASDIHIEPLEHEIRVRFRIDGVMSERVTLSKGLLPAVLSRLKLLGGMDITERRRPQDGRIAFSLSKRSIDFRVSVTPTIYGEKFVLRVLGEVQVRDVPDIEELHLSKKIYDQIKRIIHSPNGVFFVTGPTGSGKSTTLFSALKSINSPEVNIMTVEDPVEYRIRGVNQIMVNHEIGFTFASVLRSALRQDPDVILIGEIRDLETAKIATEAALTGHLVLSTLHTNSAVQAVTRLVEIGVEPFIVGPSIIGMLAQTLLRRICNDCKESYAVGPDEINRYFDWDGKQEVLFYRGKGCDNCAGSGYSGRIGIHEMVMVNDEIRELITKNRTSLEVRAAAKRGGYLPMRHDGLKKVLRGLTTIDEVERVTFSEF